jgi:hypothetical protein
VAELDGIGPMDDAKLGYFKSVFEMVTAIVGLFVLVSKLITGRKKAASMLVLKMTMVETSPV